MKYMDLSGLPLIPGNSVDTSIAEALSVEMLDERPLACANIAGESRAAAVGLSKRGKAQEIGVLSKTDAATPDRAVAHPAAPYLQDCPVVSGWQGGALR